MNYLSILALSLAACFGLQTLALQLVGGRTTKSESNFFSSIARIQTGVAEPVAEVFLLGSSRTGRLPNHKSSDPSVANLGCDAGTALITLRAIDSHRLPMPPTIVIEGGTLMHGLGLSGQEISKFLDSPWFGVGCKVPNLGATARSSAFAYSILLERKVGRADEGEKLPLPVATVPVIPPPDTEPLPEHATAVVAEMAAITDRLRKRGCRMLIVQLPPGAEAGSLNTRIPYELSRVSGIPLLDLTIDLPPGAVRYTDGVHMAPASAAAALRSILNALETL